MKKILLLLGVAILLTACGGEKEPEMTHQEFESALNDGEDMTGAVVSVEVKELAPDSAFGYNIQAGEHLNFVSESNPNVEVGDEIVVEVTEIRSVMGSYIINYKR
mgnify:CR=1 FL=1